MQKIKIYGLGGQGVVTLGKIICNAIGVYDGKYAKTMPEYGHERRGGTVFTDVIIAEEPILMNCFIYKPDIVMVLDPYVHGNGFDVTAGIHKNTILLINDDYAAFPFVKEFKECWYVNVSEISLNILHRDFPNIGMLGLFLRLHLVDEKMLEFSMAEFFGESSKRYIEVMKESYHEARKL